MLGESPFIMSRDKKIGFGCAVSSDMYLDENTSEKVVNCCGASVRRFVKNNPSEKPFRRHPSPCSS